MVVCVCNAIREREVREAARSGAACPLAAYATLERRPRCGQRGTLGGLDVVVAVDRR